jgi:hypothetical protein
MQCDPVGIEVGVALRSLQGLAIGTAYVVYQSLLGERERAPEPVPSLGHPTGQSVVDLVDERHRS